MSEQQPQDQTQGYNANAAEAIAAMPKDEQGLPVPNETAYNNSQVILEGDPEAMARSKEMDRWADTAGKHAETASAYQKEVSKRDLSMGLTHERIKGHASSNSEERAKNGVQMGGGNTIRAVEGGMFTADPQTEQFDRSPASIRLSSEEIKNKAIIKAKEII